MLTNKLIDYFFVQLNVAYKWLVDVGELDINVFTWAGIRHLLAHFGHVLEVTLVYLHHVFKCFFCLFRVQHENLVCLFLDQFMLFGGFLTLTEQFGLFFKLFFNFSNILL